MGGCAAAPSRPGVAGGLPDLPGEEVVTVEASGDANVIPGNTLNTREQALSVAQRAAVEKAVGVLIQGQMVVSQAKLVEDQVFSKTAAYLKAWDILSEKENDGLYTVTIRARVRLGNVRKDLDDLGMLIKTKRVNNPRVMILIDEKVDGKPTETGTVEAGLAKALLDRGYKVVDADQLAEIRAQENTVRAALGNEAAAAELGRRFGAEVALVGTINVKRFTMTAIPGGADAGLGADLISYRGRLNLKAVKTSSGQVALADSREGTGMDLQEEGASIRCLAQVAEAAGAEIAAKLAPALWENAEVQIEVAGVADFNALQAVMNGLRGADGVRNVNSRSFAAGTATFDVELSGGNASTLAAQLEGRRKPPMDIKEVAAYRIVAALETAAGGQ